MGGNLSLLKHEKYRIFTNKIKKKIVKLRRVGLLVA